MFSIPLTFSMILLIKSAVFYLAQEFFPEWMRQLRKPSHEVGVEHEQEERRRNILS